MPLPAETVHILASCLYEKAIGASDAKGLQSRGWRPLLGSTYAPDGSESVRSKRHWTAGYMPGISCGTLL